jgi:hypothetical protein
MRGIGTGTIALTLPETATDIRAFLYWHGPTNSSNPAANASVKFNGNDITGTNIGISNDNFWGFANSQAYRADVTSYVNVTTTSYALTNFRKTTADGVVADINGASLLVFYQDGSDGNNRDVYVKDGNDSTCGTAGVNSFDGWNITMGGVTVPVPSGKAVRLELHVSDGQNFDGDDDGAMLLNGTQFLPAGENFDGRSISPFTDNGLWDIRSFFVTSLVRADTNTLTSPHNFDCLSAVVNLLIVEDEVIVEEVLRGADWDLLAAPAVEHRRKTSALTRSDVRTSIGSSVLLSLR